MRWMHTIMFRCTYCEMSSFKNVRVPVCAKMAQHETALTKTRNLVYGYAAALDKGFELSNEDCAKAFNSASRMAKDVTRGCQEILGGQGLTHDWRMGRLVRDAQLYATGGGTEDIRDLIIARGIYNNPALEPFKLG